MELKTVSTEEAKQLAAGKNKQSHTLKPEQIQALQDGKWLAWEHGGTLHLIGAEGKVDEAGLN